MIADLTTSERQAAGLAAFFWSLCSGQYDDLDGATGRFLFDGDSPLRSAGTADRPASGRETPDQ